MATDFTPPESSEAIVWTAYKQAKGIAAAIASSLVAYVVVVEILMRTSPAVEPPAFFQSLRIALFVVSGVMIFTTTIAKGILLRDAPPDPVGRLARLRAATVTGLALAEVPVASGLVLVILGRARGDFYMLLAISAYMMVRHAPRRAMWDEYLSRGRTDVVR